MTRKLYISLFIILLWGVPSLYAGVPFRSSIDDKPMHLISLECIGTQAEFDSAMSGSLPDRLKTCVAAKCNDLKESGAKQANQELNKHFKSIKEINKIINTALNLSFHKVTRAYLKMQKDFKSSTELQDSVIAQTYKSLSPTERTQLEIFYSTIAPNYGNRYKIESTQNLKLLKSALIKITKTKTNENPIFQLSDSDFSALDIQYYGKRSRGKLTKKSYLTKLLNQLQGVYRYRNFVDEDLNELTRILSKKKKLKDVDIKKLKIEKEEAIKKIANYSQKLKNTQQICNHLMDENNKLDITIQCFGKEIGGVMNDVKSFADSIGLISQRLQTEHYIAAAPMSIVVCPENNSIKVKITHLPANLQWTARKKGAPITRAQKLINKSKNIQKSVSIALDGVKVGDEILFESSWGNKTRKKVLPKCPPELNSTIQPPEKDIVPPAIELSLTPQEISENKIPVLVKASIQSKADSAINIVCNLDNIEQALPKNNIILVTQKDAIQKLTCIANKENLESVSKTEKIPASKVDPVIMEVVLKLTNGAKGETKKIVKGSVSWTDKKKPLIRDQYKLICRGGKVVADTGDQNKFTIDVEPTDKDQPITCSAQSIENPNIKGDGSVTVPAKIAKQLGLDLASDSLDDDKHSIIEITSITPKELKGYTITCDNDVSFGKTDIGSKIKVAKKDEDFFVTCTIKAEGYLDGEGKARITAPLTDGKEEEEDADKGKEIEKTPLKYQAAAAPQYIKLPARQPYILPGMP